MRKKSPSLLWVVWKLMILLSFIFLLVAVVRINDTSPRLPDDVLEGNPRVAFMFLVRLDLPLDFLWHTFYEVDWGKSSMIEAERLLLQAALENPANQRFVLLSDSCVPLYNFSYSYSYLMRSSRSFVDSFLDMKEGRYNPRMASVIPMRKWRKGSQWIALLRSHAKVVAYDDVVFPIFKKLCKRRPPLDASKGKQNFKLQKQHNCIPDEHYVQTLLAMNNLEGELERRTVTYTSWVPFATNMEMKSWHPVTYTYASANPQQIKRIKDIRHVYYDTEHRTEWCKNSAAIFPCFLFARKFSRDGAMRLLTEENFDASASLHKSP